MKNSIKKTKEFKEVYNKRKSFSNDFFVLYTNKKENIDYNRLGISISKKVGNSVVRHKIKRRIRDVFYKNSSNLKKVYDIVIVCKKKINEIGYKEINDSFIELCKKQKIFKESND